MLQQTKEQILVEGSKLDFHDGHFNTQPTTQVTGQIGMPHSNSLSQGHSVNVKQDSGSVVQKSSQYRHHGHNAGKTL